MKKTKKRYRIHHIKKIFKYKNFHIKKKNYLKKTCVLSSLPFFTTKKKIRFLFFHGAESKRQEVLQKGERPAQTDNWSFKIAVWLIVRKDLRVLAAHGGEQCSESRNRLVCNSSDMVSGLNAERQAYSFCWSLPTEAIDASRKRSLSCQPGVWTVREKIVGLWSPPFISGCIVL